ncbi:hypothetical protein NKH71_00200 [Mesorhizobium sp. M0983]|uniref:hypothetical protein n=1 Tax=Mesorhizobium sp. M0983 TaxID=2957040 RepID=UPI00333519C7
MNIHEKLDERCGLAKTYAEDGAFHSAARVLKDLAATVEQHAIACDRMLLEATVDPEVRP